MPFTIQTTRTAAPKARVKDSELGFGRLFSDHLLSIDWDADKGWQNARIEPYGKLGLDPAAGCLHYGQAMFEGLKAFRQADGSVAIFRCEMHAARMQKGAARLCMPSLPTEDFVQVMRELVTVEDSWV